MPLFADPPLDTEHPPRTQFVQFHSHGAQIHGRIFAAQGAGSKPTIVLLHGYPGVEQNHDVAHALRRIGYHVVVFHYRGAWGSEGVFTINHALEDTIAVVEALRQPSFASFYGIDPDQVFVMGHSMGGFLALMVGARLPFIRGVATLAAFDFGAHTLLLADEDDMVQEAVYWNYEIAPLHGASGAAVVTEMVTHAADWQLSAQGTALVGRRVLLIAATLDSVAPLPLHHHALIHAYERAGVMLAHQTLEADHSFSATRVRLTEMIADWLEQSGQ